MNPVLKIIRSEKNYRLHLWFYNLQIVSTHCVKLLHFLQKMFWENPEDCGKCSSDRKILDKKIVSSIYFNYFDDVCRTLFAPYKMIHPRSYF